jgi:hypothetical protein
MPWRSDNASEIQGAAEGRGGGAGRQARRAEGQRPQRSLEIDVQSMSEKQLDEFASTKRKGKPQHASKKK